MLNVPVPFPHPGSIAFLVPSADRPTAERVSIRQHNADGTVGINRLLPEGGRDARIEFHNRGATRQLTVGRDELHETAAEACAAAAPATLSAHQREQLEYLAAEGAISQETAAAAAFDPRFNPGTLAKLAGMGLTRQQDLPYRGDTRRRVSHYWLTSVGLRSIAGAKA